MRLHRRQYTQNVGQVIDCFKMTSTKSMRKLTLHFFLSLFFVILYSNPSYAQSSSSSYSLELAAIYGINLPHSIVGHEGSYQVLGIRSAIPVGGQGALEAGLLVQHADPDRIYTLDAGYRYEHPLEGLLLVGLAGLHFSKFIVEADVDEFGDCVLEGCATDAGYKIGAYAGGGLRLPLGAQMFLGFSSRFYLVPSLWLLLEAGLGYRF